MSSPYGELIAALENLKANVEAVVPIMKTISDANPLLPAAHEAKGHGEALLGAIPLPMDHPKWGDISGALMAAMGSIDGVIDQEQNLKQSAIDAQAALQQAAAEVQATIQSFQQ